MAGMISQQLMADILLYGGLIGIAFIVCLVIGVFFYTKTFNIKTLVVEKRGDGMFKFRFINVKKKVKDGVVRYEPVNMTFGGIFGKCPEIKPNDNPKDIYSMDGKDLLILVRDSKNDYSYANFNYDGNSFSPIPQEVHYWASVKRREQELMHKAGINWSVIMAYGIIVLGMIISLLMVVFVLDWASKVQCIAPVVQQTSNNITNAVPLVGGMLN